MGQARYYVLRFHGIDDSDADDISSRSRIKDGIVRIVAVTYAGNDDNAIGFSQQVDTSSPRVLEFRPEAGGQDIRVRRTLCLHVIEHKAPQFMNLGPGARGRAP